MGRGVDADTRLFIYIFGAVPVYVRSMNDENFESAKCQDVVRLQSLWSTGEE